MDSFVRTVGGILLLLFILPCIGKSEQSLALAAVIAGCIGVMVLLLKFLLPVTDLISRIADAGDLQSETVNLMLKITGIGILTHIAVPICSESGHASLGKSLQILSSGVILYLCIPVFDRFLELITTLLGRIP